jgi:hypothetical protein
MSLKEYVVTAKSMDDLESLYNDLETAGGTATIPDRAVPVYRRRPISQCTHYMLTDEEAVKLNNDSRILNVEPMELILGSIKLNSYKQTGTFSKTTYLTGMNASWKNWALLRCLEGVQRSNWGDNGTATQTATIDVGPTGKNVDVIIIDGMCGVPDHPEFAVNADGTGGTRYVQYNWYQLNSIVSSIDDDAATLLTGNYSYSAAADVGNANHGAHTAGTACGNTQGWARDANIYQIDPVSGTIDALIMWDYIRAFHKNKPINPATGRKNPTICNCSYGSSLTFPDAGLGLSAVKQATRRGTTVGAFGVSPYTAFTSSQLNSVGMYNTTVLGTVYANVPYYIDSNAADVTAAIAEGIIVVGAAGNESYYVDNSTGTDYNNTFIASYGAETSYYLWYQHRGTVPGSVPGAICVGAVDAGKVETKEYYSNTGDRIDIFAPGTWITSSWASSTAGSWGDIAADSRNGSYYMSRDIGTSMAAPQVAGVLACILELYPNMTPAEAKAYIKYYAKTNQLTDATGLSSPGWTSNTQSLQGATNRFLFMPREKQLSGATYPKVNYNVRPTSGSVYPRVKRRIRG